MTLYEFNALDEEVKLRRLLLSGACVRSRKEGDTNVFLYQLFSFYVERYSYRSEGKSMFRTFSNVDQLEPYLQEIDISNLLD